MGGRTQRLGDCSTNTEEEEEEEEAGGGDFNNSKAPQKATYGQIWHLGPAKNVFFPSLSCCVVQIEPHKHAEKEGSMHPFLPELLSNGFVAAAAA